MWGSGLVAAAGGLVLIVGGITGCGQEQDSSQQQSGDAQLESQKQMESKRSEVERSAKAYKVAPEEDEPGGDKARVSPKELKQQK
jgi:hypothetical protein